MCTHLHTCSFFSQKCCWYSTDILYYVLYIIYYIYYILLYIIILLCIHYIYYTYYILLYIYYIYHILHSTDNVSVFSDNIPTVTTSSKLFSKISICLDCQLSTRFIRQSGIALNTARKYFIGWRRYNDQKRWDRAAQKTHRWDGK